MNHTVIVGNHELKTTLPFFLLHCYLKQQNAHLDFIFNNIAREIGGRETVLKAGVSTLCQKLSCDVDVKYFHLCDRWV